MLPDVIKSYGMSLMYGHAHTSQSLPRMLTLWFDFGTFLHASRGAGKGAGGQVRRARGQERGTKGVRAGEALAAGSCGWC